MVENSIGFNENDNVSYKNVEESKKIVAKFSLRTPLVAYNDFESETSNVYLKLENLQAIGSYKIRGACNVLHHLLSNKVILEQIKANGLVTARAGNFSQGLAYAMRLLKLDYKLVLVVPDKVAENKIIAVRKIYPSIKVVKLSNQQWFNIIVTGKIQPEMIDILEGEKFDSNNMPYYVSPTSGPHVVAGNGTIGLEIYEDLKDVDCVIVPYGGGGMVIGIAIALKHLNHSIKIFTCEIETSTPLETSLKMNSPQEADYTSSFVDGMGCRAVIPENFELVKPLIDGNLIVSLKGIVDSITKLVERNKIITEGAGAASFAAFEQYKETRLKDFKKVVCIVSGGNLSTNRLIKILQGEIPN